MTILQTMDYFFNPLNEMDFGNFTTKKIDWQKVIDSTPETDFIEIEND